MNVTAVFSMSLLTVCTFLPASPMIWLCHLDTVEVDMRNFGFVVSWSGGFLCIQRCVLHTLFNHCRCVALIASEFLDMALCGHFCFHCIKRKFCYFAFSAS